MAIGLLLFGGATFGLGALAVLWAVFGWDAWLGTDEPVNQADLEPGVTYRPVTVAVPNLADDDNATYTTFARVGASDDLRVSHVWADTDG